MVSDLLYYSAILSFVQNVSQLRAFVLAFNITDIFYAYVFSAADFHSN